MTLIVRLVVFVHLIADLVANKDRFVRLVLDTGQVCGARSDDGWAMAFYASEIMLSAP